MDKDFCSGVGVCDGDSPIPLMVTVWLFGRAAVTELATDAVDIWEVGVDEPLELVGVLADFFASRNWSANWKKK